AFAPGLLAAQQSEKSEVRSRQSEIRHRQSAAFRKLRKAEVVTGLQSHIRKSPFARAVCGLLGYYSSRPSGRDRLDVAVAVLVAAEQCFSELHCVCAPDALAIRSDAVLHLSSNNIARLGSRAFHCATDRDYGSSDRSETRASLSGNRLVLVPWDACACDRRRPTWFAGAC